MTSIQHRNETPTPDCFYITRGWILEQLKTQNVDKVAKRIKDHRVLGAGPDGILLALPGAYSEAVRKYYNTVEFPKPYSLVKFDSAGVPTHNPSIRDREYVGVVEGKLVYSLFSINDLKEC